MALDSRYAIKAVHVSDSTAAQARGFDDCNGSIQEGRRLI